MNFVIIKSYSSSIEAEIDKNLLEENGIKSIIQSPDSSRPSLEMATGVVLLVDESNLSKVKQLLVTED